MTARTLTVLATIALFSAVGFVASRALVPRTMKPVELAPFDESLFAISAASGGDFYFQPSGEFAAAELRIPVGGEDVLIAYPVLEGQRDFPFPVDGLTSRIEVFVSGQHLSDVRIIRPDGRELEDDLQRVDIQSHGHLFLGTVRTPNAGAWRLEVDGRGQVSLSVRAATDPGGLPPGTPLEPIRLVDFELLQESGEPGDEAFVALMTPPAPKTRIPARLTLSGSFVTGELGIIDPKGELLPGTSLVPLDFDDRKRAALSFVVPEVPYRLMVRGLDFSGMKYQRVLAPLQEPAE